MKPSGPPTGYLYKVNTAGQGALRGVALYAGLQDW